MQRRTDSLPPLTPARNGEAVTTDPTTIPAAPRPLPGPRALNGSRARRDRRYADWRRAYDQDARRGRGAA